jgi:hypothetical protein
VPHIVFNPAAADYFPGPEWWASARTSPKAPRERATSGLIQPPVHALALERIVRLASEQRADAIVERAQALYPQVLAWHRYLATARDPQARGLLVIYHPWESGTDNSPRWDAALGRLEVGKLPAYQRHDLRHVEDPSERPTHAEYDRYLWLVELLKQAGYDDPTIQRTHPFQIGDVLMSAIFAAACRALGRVAGVLGGTEAERSGLDDWSARFSRGVLGAWDADLGLALDWDVRAGEAMRVQTCAGLGPLLVPELDAPRLLRLAAQLEGPGFAGAPGLAYAVVPSTTPGSVGWQVRSYWRGPSWPVANWLLWWGLEQHGQADVAARLRAANLDLLGREGARFGEYFEPYTAEPLGSLDQSWTAAVALDWLAAAER